MVGYRKCVCVFVWCLYGGWGSPPIRQQGFEEKTGRNCSKMTSDPQAQWRLWLQKPQQEGLGCVFGSC